MGQIAMFRVGDVVIHPRRPEWGEGKVQKASTVTHDGKTAQRVVVVFQNHGRVTINTAVAPLLPKGASTPMSTSGTTRSSNSSSTAQGHSGGWLGSLGAKPNHAAELWRLPDSMSDPFVPPGRRLAATLDSFRYSTDARTLIDWAVAQTGLADPLSKYTRHELESAFSRFARDRNLHMLELVRTLKRQHQHHVLHEVAHATANPAARKALAKAIKA